MYLNFQNSSFAPLKWSLIYLNPVQDNCNTRFHDCRKLSKPLTNHWPELSKVVIKTRQVWGDIRENTWKKKDCPYSNCNKNDNNNFPSLGDFFYIKITTNSIDLKFWQCEQNFLLQLLKPSPLNLTPMGVLVSPQFGGRWVKNRRFYGFFGIFKPNFGGKSSKLWYLLDFYSAFLKNIGSKPCGVVFWRKWGLNLEKWPFLAIFQPFLKGYRRLNFSIHEVIFHNLLTLYLYFMLKNSLFQKFGENGKLAIFVKPPFWGIPH